MIGFAGEYDALPGLSQLKPSRERWVAAVVRRNGALLLVKRPSNASLLVTETGGYRLAP